MSPTRFKTFASLMVAVVTVLGAAAVCLASVATNQAGNADFDGLTAAIKAQEATIVSQITAYEHYRAYTAYQRYNEMGSLIYDESLQADPDRVTALGQLQREVWGVAQGLQYDFFPPRYLAPEGGYDLQRELDEQLAEASLREDLFSAPHFLLADTLRRKALLFTVVLIVLAVAFWFFNAAEIIENRAKYLFAGAGMLLTLASGGVGIVIQFLF